MANYKAVNFEQKFTMLQDHWQPSVVAELNDYQFKLVKVLGDFVWHSHAETDEAFLVLHGELRIDFRDGFVVVKQGELYVVPKGVEHKPYAEQEVQMLLVEPTGVINTGDGESSDRTADNNVRL